MKKYKMRHYETFKAGLFPQVFPYSKNDGETSHEPRMAKNPEPQRVYDQEPLLEHDPELQQSTLDKVWEWLVNPEIE